MNLSAPDLKEILIFTIAKTIPNPLRLLRIEAYLLDNKPLMKILKIQALLVYVLKDRMKILKIQILKLQTRLIAGLPGLSFPTSPSPKSPPSILFAEIASTACAAALP